MKMKYKEQLWEIKNYVERQVVAYIIYEEGVRDNVDWKKFEVESMGLTLADKERIFKNYEIINYLNNLKRGYVIETRLVKETGLYGKEKPTVEDVNILLDEYEKHLNEVKENMKRIMIVTKDMERSLKKQFDCIRHYRFQFSLEAWYEKLPNEIYRLNEMERKLDK